MGYVFAFLTIAVYLVFMALTLRVVLDWVQMFARYWRPRGAALVLASAVYAVTDPPMNFLRKRVRPLNIGGISLDIAFLIFAVAVWILFSILRTLTYNFS